METRHLSQRGSVSAGVDSEKVMLLGAVVEDGHEKKLNIMDERC